MKQTKLNLLSALLLVAAMTFGTNVWATEHTVTYTITNKSDYSGYPNGCLLTFTPNNSGFGTSTGTKVAAIQNLQNTNGFEVQLDDGVTLRLSLSNGSSIFCVHSGDFEHYGISLNANGNQNVRFTVACSDYYITHIKLAQLDGTALEGIGNPAPTQSGSLDLDVDIDKSTYNNSNYQAWVTQNTNFGQLTITLSDAPRLSILESDGVNAYKIKSKDDLRHLAAYVNNGHNDCNGLTFRQTQTITCDNTYTPIGYYILSDNQAYFRGTYDGQGNTVSGIAVTRTGYANADSYIGLFGYIGNGGTVRNVVIASSTFTGYDKVGGIAGYNLGTIRNCRVESTVAIKAGNNSAMHHGGIVGNNHNGPIIGCVSAARILNNNKTNHQHCGGIVGHCYGGTVRDCLYIGNTVEAADKKGAIVGHAENNPTYANNYYTANNLGGVEGNDQDGARRARTVTLGEDVALIGEETATYSLSGITAIGTGNYAMRYNSTLYSGATQTLTLSYTGDVPDGYTACFAVNSNAIEGNTFQMPASNVTVSAILRLAIPYSYGFEEEWSWNEWTNLSGSNERAQSFTHTDNYKLVFQGSTNNIVVLPQFQYEANTLQINFWTRPEKYYYDECGTFSVGYLTDPADASTFVALKTYNYSDWTADEYLQKTVYLYSLHSGARIAFRHNPLRDDYFWYVDDVEVSLLPSCIPPEDLAVSGIDTSVATFNWTAVAGADWEYGIVANAAQNYVPTDADFTGTTTANSVTLNTLSQLTTYTFYLRRACSAQDKSEVASVSFSTTQPPVAVPFSDDFEGDACQWALENGNAENQWHWGTATSCSGTKALYISNDGGNSNSYSNNSQTKVYASKLFTFADGDYYFSYNWRCNGDNHNFMRVALAPASASLPSSWNYSYSLPDGWIALDEGNLYYKSSWQAFQSEAITVPAGQYKMVVVWSNSDDYPNNPPAAIDNISISTYLKTFTTAGLWNEASNWSPAGVPASTEHVRIAAAATIPSGCVAEAASIVIVNNSGSLTLADGGQLVCYHDLYVTVQKAIAPYTTNNDGWNLFAMPFINGQHPTSITGLIPSEQSTVYDLYRLKEQTTCWENYKQHGTGFFIHPIYGNGACLYATSVGTTLQGNSRINPNTVEGETAYLSKDGDGWNLIANPFTCTAYVNRPFLRMNATGSALELVENYWQVPLNVCEGIVVQADDSIPLDSCTFTRTAPVQPTSGGKGGLQMALTQANSRGNVTLDNAIVSFNEGVELGKFYFGEQDANICIPQDGKDYAIVSAEAHGEIPVCFKAKKNGEYTLTVSSPLTSHLSSLTYLHLIDNIAGKDIDLLAASSYAFTARNDDYPSRFKLVFSNENDNQNEDDNENRNEDFAFISNGEIFVNGDGIVQVVDMMGHVLVNREIHSDFRLPTSDFSSGVYVLRLINGESARTQKIVIK